MIEQVKEMFPRKLYKAIQDANANQKGLASRVGISEVSISRYCSGLQVPNIITISLIAKELNCELYELIPYYDPTDGRIK